MSRRYYFNLLFLVCCCNVNSQVNTQNYILTRTMLNETGNASIEKIAYYDGLGRLFQTVEKGITPSKLNLATLQEYDNTGRKAAVWLPITSAADCVMSATFKNSAPGNYENDSRPFSEPIYDASPLNRIVKQYGPGSAWYSEHAVQMDYQTNTTSFPLNCIHYSVNGSNSLVSNGNYAAKQLYVVKTTDEDYKVNYEFKDKLGRVILTRQVEGNKTYDTYYVYDDLGNKRFVLQPMYQQDSNLALYAYQYKYDEDNHCIEKKFPGVEPIKYIYDMADNLIFSQDGSQRTTNKWTFYLYDKFKRLTVTGICSNANISFVASNIIFCTCTYSNTGLGNSGYTSNLPLTSPLIYLVNYYDTYDFRSLTGFINNTYFPQATVDAKGSLTGCVTMIMENGFKLYSANYYDVKGRITKTVSSNHLGGYDTTNTTYTFTNKPLTVQRNHTANGMSPLTEVYTYTYDHAERIIKVQHTLNGNTVTLTMNTYDNLGRLITKTLHNTPSNRFTYIYNIHGWLTEIKHPKFTQNLYYNTGNSSACYNGNISSMTWGSEGDIVRGYKFTYDNLNRLKNAVYGEGGTMSTNVGRFSENVTEYDKNSNIKTLQRNGKIAASTYGIIDNLTITYNGNQLKNVNDVATDPLYSGAFNFMDGLKSTGTEYIYDNNGNLKKDYNKKISNIQYNQLNLPSTIQFADGSCIDYLYSADGVKHRVVHKTVVANVSVPMGQINKMTKNQTTQNHVLDYCNNVIYENGRLSKILTEEGYISLDETGAGSTYHYYLKDHQGNNRLVINQIGIIEQINHYYPFGGIFDDNIAVSQPYRYNGKELDRMYGLDWYDYGARNYDSAIGRFTTIDPETEKYSLVSPYVYCKNNPINRIDPDGKDDYIVDSRGRLHFYAKGDVKKPDRLYNFSETVKNPIGDNNIAVSDKNLLPGMLDVQNRKNAGCRTYGITQNLKDAAEVFNFVVTNSDAEWKLNVYNYHGKYTAILATKQDADHVQNSDLMQQELSIQGNRIIDIHSHTNANGTKGGSPDDLNNAKIDKVRRAVYFKANKTLYEYNSSQSNIREIPVRAAIDILIQMGIK